MKAVLVILCLLLTIASCLAAPGATARAANESVNVWLTTSDLSTGLQQQQNVSFAPDDGTTPPLSIKVDETNVYQSVDGFGASMTDASAWLLSAQLNPSTRDSLMTALFDPNKGIGISWLRQSMGANDVITGTEYSYDDTPGDTALVNFSIARDQDYIIPRVQQALQLNPALKITLTPWSPPGWMHDSGSLDGGNFLTQYDSTYANYFVKAIQAYQSQSPAIPIYAVTPQNEPLYGTTMYPSVYLPADQENTFVKSYLGPALATAGLTTTKILAYDHNWDTPSYPETLLGDSATNPYVAGTAWHRYGGDVAAQTQVHNDYPSKDTYYTECSTDNSLSFTSVFNTCVINVLRNWSRTTVFYNIAAEQNGGSGPYGPGHCGVCRPLVVVNPTTGTWTYNADYYALGHVSKFVQPGAYRIGSNTFGAGSVEDVAFRNPDGSRVLVVLNDGSGSATFKVKWGVESFSYTLAAGAAATFKWSGLPTLTSFDATNRVNLATNRIEAEFYSAKSNNPQTEPTTDNGGGLDVGFINNGDYLEYNNVNFGTGAGASQVQARVATNTSGGTIQFHLDSITGPQVGGVSVNYTGGWQQWTTVTGAVSGATGIHNLYVVFTGSTQGVANLNWFSFTVPRPAVSTIRAEDYDARNGPTLETTSDTGGGNDVGYTNAGNYLLYKGVDFGAGAPGVQARVASGGTGGTIEFHLDSPTGATIATVSIAGTGGWQSWQTNTASVSGAIGVHDLYVVFTAAGNGGIANLNWFTFGQTGGQTGKQLFYDGFEDGSAAQWTPYDGTWAVCQVPPNSKEYCGSDASENISLAGNTGWANDSVQGYLVANGTTNAGIGLLGRVQDGTHFYQLEIKDGNTWDIYKDNGGTWTPLASGSFTWTAGTYYLLKLDMNGSTLTASYSTDNGTNWNTLGTGTDSTFASGEVGLRVWGTTGRFDQITVISD